MNFLRPPGLLSLLETYEPNTESNEGYQRQSANYTANNSANIRVM